MAVPGRDNGDQSALAMFAAEDVAAVTLSYETLRAEALSRSGSLDKLKEVRQTWT